MAQLPDLLNQIRARLDLDAETEYEILEEIRAHLEDAVVEAREGGLNEEAALAEAAARFGVHDVGRALQAVHIGWGVADGVFAAALPVILTLVLRWVVFAPDGTAIGWQELSLRPVFWVVSAVALAVPLLRWTRWRYGLAAWTVFWILSVLFVILPASRW
jgi:hypothetical protein